MRIYPLIGEFCLELLEHSRVCFIKVIELEQVRASTDPFRFLQCARNERRKLNSSHWIMLKHLENTELSLYL
jgi:hypothetical protein